MLLVIGRTEPSTIQPTSAIYGHLEHRTPSPGGFRNNVWVYEWANLHQQPPTI